MSEDNNDPLSADVGDKDNIKMPLLPADKIVRLEIRKVAKVISKSNPRVKRDGNEYDNEMLNVPCHLTEDATAVDGTKINKGFPIFHRIMLTPTDERPAKQIAADVTKLCLAVGVKGLTVRQLIDDPVTHLEGKIFDAKTKINKEKDGYPESNSINPIPLA